MGGDPGGSAAALGMSWWSGPALVATRRELGPALGRGRDQRPHHRRRHERLPGNQARWQALGGALLALACLFGGAEARLAAAPGESLPPGRAAPSATAPMALRLRPMAYLQQERSRLTEAIQAAVMGRPAPSGSEFSIVERHPMQGGWVLVKGGSFGMCSDDIVFFALHHPGRRRLRLLLAECTGTVEGGRSLIGPQGDWVVVGRECLGREPPRRYHLNHGRPERDRRFERALRDAFAALPALAGRALGEHYDRDFALDAAGRLQVMVTVSDRADPDWRQTFILTIEERQGRWRVSISPRGASATPARAP